MRTTTSSPLTLTLGLAAALALAGTVVLGLTLPATVEQGDYSRLIAIHPGVAWASYLCFGVTALASAAWLWPTTRDPRWDLLAGASAEIGVVFTALTLATGSIWGRPTWGTYWDWDPRITSTTFLFVLLVGFLALRRIDNEAGDAAQRGTRGAIAGLLLFPNVVVVHYSVDWWRSLHQTATITRLDPSIEGSMLFTLMLGIVVFGVVFAWLLVHRFRLGWLEEQVERSGLDRALEERRAEAEVAGGVA